MNHRIRDVLSFCNRGWGKQAGLARNGPGRERRRSRLFLEILEERRVLSMITWNVSGGGSWDNPNNWSPAQVPGSGDDAVINLSSAGTITLSSGMADQAYSVSTNANATLTVSNGSLTLGAGSTSFGGPVVVSSGAELSAAGGATITLGTAKTLTDNGTLQFAANDMVSMNGNGGNNGIIVGAGATLTADTTTFKGINSANITVNSGGTITPTNSTFSLPIFVPYNDVSALTGNFSFHQININSGTISGAELDLNSIGTNTSSLSYNFPGAFTVASGAKIVVSAGVSVTLGTAQTLTDSGTLQFGANDMVSMNGNGGNNGISVGAGGTLTADTTTFTGINSANITVNSGGTITPTNSTFSLPIFVPYNDVPSLTPNFSFHQININSATISGAELDLNLIGTDASSLSYNFPGAFTVASGDKIAVGSGVSVTLGTAQTLTDNGTVQFAANDMVSMNGNGGNNGISVGAGGTLSADTTTFTGINSANITVNSGGTITPTNSTFSLPIFVPYNDVSSLPGNFSFHQININPGTISGAELDLNLIGTDTSSLSYNFPGAFTVASAPRSPSAPGLP